MELFCEPADLCAFLGLECENAPYAIEVAPRVPMLVTRSFARRMRCNDWFDPLLLQVLPRCEESVNTDGFDNDPVGDCAALRCPGLIHKYSGRALLLATAKCASHCRFCFRRNIPSGLYNQANEQVWHYLSANPDIDELILSGGDPLCIETQQIQALFKQFLAQPNLSTLRIHTRAPVFDPSLVDNVLCTEIAQIVSQRTAVIVLHVNHAQELDKTCCEAIARLRGTGALVLWQGVLLRGINDSVPVLLALMKQLIRIGVTPYYLHQLDRAQGCAHFEVSQNKGRELLHQLRNGLPGYAVPRYVREQAGSPFKDPL